ncbi:hypothetical protein GOBAR_AA39628 [Gossypium barbadense]|uniref:Uncharacterized protein n=1 Tax=Gossypium barbadense TaxID=3634 RepID=A0A2P5VQG1_GOSBA|nr:hypothetical protein GOBAR_AA39628 [Gossypium barbadense]
MTTGRINQVAFLRDVGTAWPSTCPVSYEEVITEHEHPRSSTSAPTRPRRFKGAHSGHKARLRSTTHPEGHGMEKGRQHIHNSIWLSPQADARSTQVPKHAEAARAESHDRGDDVSTGVSKARAWAAATTRVGPRPEPIGGPALAVPHPTGAHRRPPSASLPTISSTL